MPRRAMKYFACTVIYLTILTTIYRASAQDESSTSENKNHLDTLLIEKLEFYRQQFPEMSFLLLKGDDHVLANMIVLGKVLGRQPRNLDYEHPPKLREELMTASVNRISVHLQYRMPSASLFLADSTPDRQEHVCVLTIHPEEVAADSMRATQSLLDLPQAFIKRIPIDLRLHPIDYLEFVIDHEVYHCLQSMYVGPQKMSHKEFWGEYNSYHNEQGADAYALGMHINTRLEVPAFARNILRIRGMSLFSADPDHLTCKALQQIFNVPVEDLAEMNAREIFNTANKIKERLTISYDDYLLYLASSVQAMKELGVEKLISDDLRNRIRGIKSDPLQVKELVTNTHHYLSDLSCDELG